MSPPSAHPNPAIHLYLASASPRRRILLEQIGVRFQTLSLEVPEERQPGESPEEYALRLALDKARAGYGHPEHKGSVPVLGADTVVVLDEQVLEKPRDHNDALAMLAALSGRQHEVLSAVALVNKKEKVVLNKTRVWFRETSVAEREAYWHTGEPKDKAGAYGIQGMAAVFIEKIEGSFSGVMGLPLFETASLLKEFDIKILGS